MTPHADNFYTSERVTVQKVTFQNQYGMKVAGNLFIPNDLDRSATHPALVVGHPMGAVKEQSANLYATKRQQLRLGAQPELLALLRKGLPLDTPLYAEAVHTHQPRFTEQWDAVRAGVPHSEGYGAAATVPLVVNGEVRGFVALGLRLTHRWSERDQGVVRAVGRGLNLALERAETARRRRGSCRSRTRNSTRATGPSRPSRSGAGTSRWTPSPTH